MTVLVGVAHEGKVYIGADRGMSEKGFLGSIINHKIKRVGSMIVGYSGSQGTGQLAHHATYNMTPMFENDLEAWLRLEFASAIQQVAEQFKLDINNDDNAASFLVGSQGRIFEVTTADWSVSEYREIATGSGYQYAFGYLYATKGEDPKTRVRGAVSAAIAYSPECAKPVDLLVL